MFYDNNFQKDQVANIASPRGELMDYVQKLKSEMEEHGCEKEYIELCTKYARQLCDNNMPVIFDFKHLSLLIGLEVEELAYYLFVNEDEFYSTVKISKRAGGFRTIDSPSERLKNVQRWILKNILKNVQIHNSCIGFRDGKSIFDNAAYHTNKACVLNMDLKDFFPSIKQKDVFLVFYKLGYTKKVAYYLAKLLTKNGQLPQGSPASPMISNIVAFRLDNRLEKLAESFGACYSRYADDLTFSGDRSIINMIPVIDTIVLDEKFFVNNNKTRYAYAYQHQEVTGLTVNEKVSVSKKYIRSFKKEIYFCKKFGVTSHLKKTNNHKSFFKEHMYGKAYFINMIDREAGKKLLGELDSIEWDY